MCSLSAMNPFWRTRSRGAIGAPPQQSSSSTGNWHGALGVPPAIGAPPVRCPVGTPFSFGPPDDGAEEVEDEWMVGMRLRPGMPGYVPNEEEEEEEEQEIDVKEEEEEEQEEEEEEEQEEEAAGGGVPPGEHLPHVDGPEVEEYLREASEALSPSPTATTEGSLTPLIDTSPLHEHTKKRFLCPACDCLACQVCGWHLWIDGGKDAFPKPLPNPEVALEGMYPVRVPPVGPHGVPHGRDVPLQEGKGCTRNLAGPLNMCRDKLFWKIAGNTDDYTIVVTLEDDVGCRKPEVPPNFHLWGSGSGITWGEWEEGPPPWQLQEALLLQRHFDISVTDSFELAIEPPHQRIVASTSSTASSSQHPPRAHGVWPSGTYMRKYRITGKSGVPHYPRPKGPPPTKKKKTA